MIHVTMEQRFTTGSLVPCSGLYTVLHQAHRLPREVILIEGEPFPRCRRCSCPVVFVLRKRADIFSSQPYSAVRLHQLPAAKICTLQEVVLALREYRDSSLQQRALRKRSTVQQTQALRHAAQRLRQQGQQLRAASHLYRARAWELLQR